MQSLMKIGERWGIPIVAFLIYAMSCLGCQDQGKVEVEQTLTVREQRLPENALAGVTAAEGLVAQLFAHEPMVRNPSNIDVDHRGRVWVVENVNYRPERNPDNPYQEGGDMVVILEDKNNDGQADSRKIFFHDPLVDGAMGIAVFDNQVYLSSSPHILILTDDDRDDKADQIDTLFTGLGRKQGDHTVHAVTFGPDGRLYFNYGNATPEIRDKVGKPVVDRMGNVVNNSGQPYRQGMVFRCEMDGRRLDALGHNFRNNFEVGVDSYGRMWQSDNDDDGNRAVRINYIMEYGNFGYRDEMTGASWQESRSGMHEEIPQRHWHQNDPGVIPNLYIIGSGSPCGILFYEGKLLPERFHNQVIHADAGPGAIWSFILEDAGAGFSAECEPLLMRSRDTWYRPTDVVVAPDGSLFVADWYDPGVGGHWAGDPHRGRIFRLTTPKARNYKVPTIDVARPLMAIEALKSSNIATRYLAWQALEDFGRQGEVALLKLWKSENLSYRARSLWLLARIDHKYIQQGLIDPDPMIRSTAIRVARQWIPQELRLLIKPMLRDPSPKVRREIAIALHEMEGEIFEYWVPLADQYQGEDRWYLEALGIGASRRWDSCLEQFLTHHSSLQGKAVRDIIWRSRSSRTFDLLIKILMDTSLTQREIGRFLRATDFVDSPEREIKLAKLFDVDRGPRQSAFTQMLLTHLSPEFARTSGLVQQAVANLLPKIRGTEEYIDLIDKLSLTGEVSHLYQMAIDHPGLAKGVRAAAVLIKLKGYQGFERGISGPDASQIIQLMGAIDEDSAKQLLVDVIVDEAQEAALRRRAVEALAQDWGWEERIIDLVMNKMLDDKLRVLAATKLLNAARDIDRQVGISYLNEQGESVPGITELPPLDILMTRSGDLSKGKLVFESFCSNCHQIHEEGIAFGPDLSDISNKLGKDALYGAILFPNAAISHGFEGIRFLLKDSTEVIGYILSENDREITLKVSSGLTQSLIKEHIIAREALSHSLMTPGLGQAMGEDRLVDLMEYLTNLIDYETVAENPFQGKLFFEREN